MAWTYTGSAVQITYDLDPAYSSSSGPETVAVSETTPCVVVWETPISVPWGSVGSWHHVRMFMNDPSVYLWTPSTAYSSPTTASLRYWPASDIAADPSYASSGYTVAEGRAAAGCGSLLTPSPSILYRGDDRLLAVLLSLDMDITTAALGSAFAQPVRATCVHTGPQVFSDASHASSSSWIVEFIRNYGTFDPAVGTGMGYKHSDGEVKIGHPKVLRMPDESGWLMVMQRQRTLTTAGLVSTGAETEETLSDVIAYYCESSSFTGDVHGPILLVDSLDALPDQKVRLWLGFASATFAVDPSDTENIDPDLFVYFAAEFTDHGYLRAEDNLVKSYDDALFDWVNGSTSLSEWMRLTCPSERPYNGKEMDEYDRVNTFMMSVGGIGCKRISWAVLKNWLGAAQAGVYPDQSTWTLSTARGIDTKNLGLVRLWIADHSWETPLGTFYAVDSFRRVFPAGPDGSDIGIQKTTDPAPITASDSGQMTLYFTALKGQAAATYDPTTYPWPDASEDLGQGHGIWRAAAIPSGKYLYLEDLGEVLTSVFGVDFVSATWDWDATLPSPAGDSDDLVAPSDARTTGIYGAEGTFGDPDPVELPDGSWAVFTIGVAYDAADTGDRAFEFLARFDGLSTDGDREWSDVF